MLDLNAGIQMEHSDKIFKTKITVFFVLAVGCNKED